MYSIDLRRIVEDWEERLPPSDVDALVKVLVATPARADLAAASRRYQRPEVGLALLREVARRRHGRPAELLCLARAALTIGKACRVPVLSVDIAAQARAEVANALRIMGALRQATAEVQRAEAEMGEGSGCPILAGFICWVGGVIATERRRWVTAHGLLERAANSYRSIQQEAELASVLLSQAKLHSLRGRPADAQRTTLYAMEHLTAQQQPQVALWALHNFASQSLEAGVPSLARWVLNRMGPLYRVFGGSVGEGRRAWLAGRVAAGLCELVAARRELEAALQQFVDHDRPHEVGMVALELALLEAQEGSLRAACERVQTATRLVAEAPAVADACAVLLRQLQAALLSGRALGAGAAMRLIARAQSKVRRKTL